MKNDEIKRLPEDFLHAKRVARLKKGYADTKKRLEDGQKFDPRNHFAFRRNNIVVLVYERPTGWEVACYRPDKEVIRFFNKSIDEGLKQADEYCRNTMDFAKRTRSKRKGTHNFYLSEAEIELMLEVFPDAGKYKITRNKLLKALEKIKLNPLNHSATTADLNRHPLETL